MSLESFIYDFDGTLSNSYPIFLKIAKEIIAEHAIGCDLSDREIYRILKNRNIEVYHALKWRDGFGPKDFTAAFAVLQGKYAAQFQLYPYAKEILEAAIAKGKRNFLYTHSGKVVYDIMDHMGISQYFTYVLDASQGFPSKPAPDALEHLKTLYSLDPNACVMVGDRPLDVEAGANAGMQSFLFDPDGFFDQTPATYRSHSLDALFDLILN